MTILEGSVSDSICRGCKKPCKDQEIEMIEDGETKVVKIEVLECSEYEE